MAGMSPAPPVQGSTAYTAAPYSGGELYYEYLLPDLILIVHTANPPTKDAWTRYVEALIAAMQTQAGRPPRNLVFTLGGGPNAKQRNEVNAAKERWAASQPRTAVCTDSVVIRGIATAMRWLGTADTRVYRLNEVEEALGYLGTSEIGVTLVRQKRDAAFSGLGHVP